MYRTIETWLAGTGEPETHADGGAVRYCGSVYLQLARWDYQIWDGEQWRPTDTIYIVGRVMPMVGWSGNVSNWVSEARYDRDDEVAARQEYARLLMECQPAMTGAEFMEMVGQSTAAGCSRSSHKS